MSDIACKPIPITVFTGFLGSGKTTLILSLLPQLPKEYKVVLLKNEFGDVEVDSQLAKQSSLTAVSEILNGCMCCVLVGQMKSALIEIKEKFSPDRVIIETSGSAFPATLAFQIRELEKETEGAFKLDAIVTVIDAENFTGYEDTSTTAKMQARYTDIMLINKWELVTERQLDLVMDKVFTLNESTPKVKCNGRSVDPSLIFGLDSKLFSTSASEEEKARWVGGSMSTHSSEVETVTIGRRKGLRYLDHLHSKDCGCRDGGHHHDHGHSDRQDDTLSNSITHQDQIMLAPLTSKQLTNALNKLSKEVIYRLKGFIRIRDAENSGDDNGNDRTSSTFILNWAFGRFELTPYSDGVDSAPEATVETEKRCLEPGEDMRLTMMGERGEVSPYCARFASAVGATCS